MVRSKSTRVLRPSLMDRLSGEPGTNERLYFEGIGVRELRESVARDLERLLNTRVWFPIDSGEEVNLSEARRSLLFYGIPDLSTFSWANPRDCRRIANLVESAVRTFEPRLLPSSIHCEILPNKDAADFSLKLRIEAILHVDPISEPVAFDSTADFDGGGIRIESFE